MSRIYSSTFEPSELKNTAAPIMIHNELPVSGDIQAELETAWLADPGRESCPEEGQMKVQAGTVWRANSSTNVALGGQGES